MLHSKILFRNCRESEARAAQGIAESSRRIGDAIDRAVTTIQGSEARTRELTEHLGATLERVSRTWVEYEQRFADVDKSLEEALAKIVGIHD